MRLLLRSPIFLLAASAAVAVLSAGPALAHPSTVTGSVHQVAGKDGCYTAGGSSSAGPGTCRKIRGGTGATTIAISPGGRSAYLIGYGSGGSRPPVLSVFRRDPTTGVLRQLAGKAGCFSRNGSSNAGPRTCTKARDLDSGDATSIVISADGRFVYVASQYFPGRPVGGIAVFSRSLATGALRQLSGKLGCVSADGSSNAGPHTCAVGREADDVSNLVITPDQKYLYASNYDSQPNSGIAIFRRDPRTGSLHQLTGMEGCITDDGTTVQSGNTVVCRAMPNIGTPWDISVPDNHFAYVPDRVDHLVQAFRRDAKGGLVPLIGLGACVSDTGNSPLGPGTCVQGRGLFDVERAVLSKNKRFIYTNSYKDPAPIAVLNRNLVTGLLSQRAGTAACVSLDGTTGDSGLSCRVGRALSGGYAGALAPNGVTLYFADFGRTAGGALLVFRVSPRTGGFTQLPAKLGCVTADGSSQAGPGTCGRARVIQGAYQVAIASGGRYIYVASLRENGASLFRAAG